MKKIALILLICFTIGMYIEYHLETVQADIATSLLRLHVVANSDSPHDQDLKLKVRDRVITEMNKLMNNSNSASLAKKIAENNLSNFEMIANDVLVKNGSNDKAVALLGSFPFPTETYGEVSLPAGDYEALKIVIGKGEGKNWWCVLFPPLCFIGVTAPQMSVSSKNTLKRTLTQEEYKLISSQHSELPVTIKFKLIEIINALIENHK